MSHYVRQQISKFTNRTVPVHDNKLVRAGQRLFYDAVEEGYRDQWVKYKEHVQPSTYRRHNRFMENKRMYERGVVKRLEFLESGTWYGEDQKLIRGIDDDQYLMSLRQYQPVDRAAWRRKYRHLLSPKIQKAEDKAEEDKAEEDSEVASDVASEVASDSIPLSEVNETKERELNETKGRDVVPTTGPGRELNETKGRDVVPTTEFREIGQLIRQGTLVDRISAFGQFNDISDDDPLVIVKTIYIPKAEMGTVVGRGGINIKRIGKDTKCKIRALKGKKDTFFTGKVVLEGNARQIHRAIFMVKNIHGCLSAELFDKISAIVQFNDISDDDPLVIVKTIDIPNGGISNAGRTDKIRKHTQCKIVILKDDQDKSFTGKVVLEGTARQIHRAIFMIQNN